MQAANLAEWNKTLEQRVEEQLAELTSLLEVSQLLVSSLEFDEVLRLILVTVSRLMKADSSSVLLVDPTTNELVFQVPFGPASEQLHDFRLKSGQGLAGWVVTERQAALVNDVTKDPRFDRLVDRVTGFHTQSILAAPLQDRDRVLGVIEVLNTTKQKRFELADLDLLSAFAAHASMALRNAQLVSTIKEENQYLQEALEERYRTLIGESAPMQKAMGT